MVIKSSTSRFALVLLTFMLYLATEIVRGATIGSSQIPYELTDSGYGNILMLSRTELVSSAIVVQNLTYYATVPAGTLTLGIYTSTDSTGSWPSTLITSTHGSLHTSCWLEHRRNI